MIDRLASALPILVAITSLGLTSSSWPIALLLALACLGAIASNLQLEVDRGRQLVVSVTGAIAGYALTAALFEQERGGLTEGWTKLAAALLLAVIARLTLRSPAGGAPLNAAMTFVAMVALGQSHGHGYPILSALFLAALVMALRSADGAQLTSARWKGALSVTLLTAVLATAATSGLRVAYALAMRKAKTSNIGWRAQKGFSDQIQLGAVDGMLDSDTLVLRVTGPRVDYLRGAAFDEYEAGRWMRSERLKTEVETLLPTGPLDGDVTHIQAINESTDRYFLPLEVTALSAPTPQAKVDGLGNIKRAGGGAASVDLLLGPRRIAPLAPPGPLDLAMGRSTRHQVAPLAAAWTTEATTASERLDAIERHLMGEYQYATMIPQGVTIDPAVDFLLHDRKGHCELFATGMALLARASGIPARVVVGYRVAERSPIGAQWLVRERNAHAWVEAWVDGQWVRRDPTPELLVPQNIPHDASYAAAIADTLRVQYAELRDWLERRSITETSLASLAGLIVLGIIVARGVRSTKKQQAPDADAAPLPSLTLLLDALGAAGAVMLPGESIERFAARVADRESAAALLAYAAMRYGGVGDRANIDAMLSDRAAALKAQRAQPRSKP